MSKEREEYLEALMHSNEVTDRLVEKVEVIMSHGTEGLQEIAEASPELLLTMIELMTQTIATMRTTIIELSDDWLDALDALEK